MGFVSGLYIKLLLHSILMQPMTASQPYINFLPKHPYARPLGLLPGDLETFNNIIHLIGEYEGMSI